MEKITSSPARYGSGCTLRRCLPSQAPIQQIMITGIQTDLFQGFDTSCYYQSMSLEEEGVTKLFMA